MKGDIFYKDINIMYEHPHCMNKNNDGKKKSLAPFEKKLILPILAASAG